MTSFKIWLYWGQGTGYGGSSLDERGKRNSHILTKIETFLPDYKLGSRCIKTKKCVRSVLRTYIHSNVKSTQMFFRIVMANNSVLMTNNYSFCSFVNTSKLFLRSLCLHYVKEDLKVGTSINIGLLL